MQKVKTCFVCERDDRNEVLLCFEDKFNKYFLNIFSQRRNRFSPCRCSEGK